MSRAARRDARGAPEPEALRGPPPAELEGAKLKRFKRVAYALRSTGVAILGARRIRAGRAGMATRRVVVIACPLARVELEAHGHVPRS